MKEEIDDLLEKADILEEQGLKTEALELLREASRPRDDPIVLTRLGALATDLELWLDYGAATLSIDFKANLAEIKQSLQRGQKGPGMPSPVWIWRLKVFSRTLTSTSWARDVSPYNRSDHQT